MLTPGDEIEVTVEKPAAGGRMIARHDGQIVLVSNAIPGERALVRLERVEKRLAFASAVRIVEASADRRDSTADPRCGGCAYAHIAYPRQITLKADIIHDAFARIGRIPLQAPVPVAASPESGYRMRARFHVRDGVAGFYRENTHDICDAAATRQVTEASIAAIERALSAFGDARSDCVGVELSENVAADERALHFDLASDAQRVTSQLAEAVSAAQLTGCTARGRTGGLIRVGVPAVSDPLAVLTHGRAPAGRLARHPTSFFQANRFVLPDLVVAVLESVLVEGPVLDLYAGVGLFSTALAASGRGDIVAVEGDRDSAADLRQNAAQYAGAVRAVVGRVEDHIANRRDGSATIVVDPPRTGISREAMDLVAAHGASRIVYVSCDPPTMARDARRLLDGGYRLDSLRGFDLFPNTPHVEAVGVFTRAGSAAC